MKRLFVLMSCAVLLTACASRTPVAQWVPPVTAAQAPILTDANGYAIESIPFRAGVSSVTVEKMAQKQGCTGGQGAGLMTPQGPIEVYRMICDSRQVFMARCELRQCRPMAVPPPGGYSVIRVPAAATVVQVPAAAIVVQGPAATTAVQVPVATPAVQIPAGTTVVQVPADSTVHVATIPDAKAASASIPAGPGSMGPKQVPQLAFDWQCGGCAQNEKVAPLILAGYKMEAAKEGYTVSEAETATVSIVDYRQRPIGMRIAFGFMSGKDRLGTRIGFRGQTLQAASSTAMAIKGMNAVSEEVGRRAFTELRKTTN